MNRVNFLLLVALCLTACGHRENAQREQAPLKVKTMVLSPSEGGMTSRYVGTIEPIRETPLSLQSVGRVVSISAKNGQRVKKGQTLMAIDNTQAMNALQTAEASLKHAQDGYDRVSKVHSKGVVSDQKMVEIESQLAQAKSLYEAAKQQLAECTLTAPCDGLVDGLNIEIGQTIIPGTKICSLLDVTAFNVRFTVPEAEINGLESSRKKIEGTVECAAIDTILPIAITEKGVTANPLTHTYDVVAAVRGGAGLLKTGMVGKVLLNPQAEILHPKSETLNIIIPASCVLMKPEGPTVWILSNGEAERSPITLDGYQADGVRVSSGLQAGDTLIVEGYQKLYKGCKISCEDK